MISLKNQRGFAGVELVLIIAVVAALSFAGFKAYEARQAPEVSIPVKTSTVDVPEKITNVKELNQAELVLDNTKIEADSTSELDAELSAF